MFLRDPLIQLYLLHFAVLLVVAFWKRPDPSRSLGSAAPSASTGSEPNEPSAAFRPCPCPVPPWSLGPNHGRGWSTLRDVEATWSLECLAKVSQAIDRIPTV